MAKNSVNRLTRCRREEEWTSSINYETGHGKKMILVRSKSYNLLINISDGQHKTYYTISFSIKQNYRSRLWETEAIPNTSIEITKLSNLEFVFVFLAHLLRTRF